MTQPKLIDVEILARQAGAILRAGFSRRPGFGQLIQVDIKGENDLITEIDHRSEEYLVQEIQNLFPGDQILTEEQGEFAGSNGHIWHIDPLDGTVNYAHGVPIFCVSIAYQVAGDLHLGAVYDPLQDECFSAERGKGAWLNGEPIHVSSHMKWSECLLVTGFPYKMFGNPRNNLEEFSRLSALAQGTRRIGSSALDLSYVAAGRLDGFWELEINSWDIAAGRLIVEEAGGKVTNLQGMVHPLAKTQSIVAANPGLHPLLLEVLSG